MTDDADNLTNAGADNRVESALLQRVLDLHPTRMSGDELVRDLAGEGADFGARDAVERAIRVLEDSPLFNAGKGAVFTHDGRNELDASIMEGKSRTGGAVAFGTAWP